MTAGNLTLFDLDGTLIAGDSDHSFGEFMVDIGWADADSLARAATTRSTQTYQEGRARRPRVRRVRHLRAWRTPQRRRSRPAIHERFMHEVIAPDDHAAGDRRS